MDEVRDYLHGVGTSALRAVVLAALVAGSLVGLINSRSSATGRGFWNPEHLPGIPAEMAVETLGVLIVVVAAVAFGQVREVPNENIDLATARRFEILGNLAQGAAFLAALVGILAVFGEFVPTFREYAGRVGAGVVCVLLAALVVGLGSSIRESTHAGLRRAADVMEAKVRAAHIHEMSRLGWVKSEQVGVEIRDPRSRGKWLKRAFVTSFARMGLWWIVVAVVSCAVSAAYYAAYPKVIQLAGLMLLMNLEGALIVLTFWMTLSVVFMIIRARRSLARDVGGQSAAILFAVLGAVWLIAMFFLLLVLFILSSLEMSPRLWPATLSGVAFVAYWFWSLRAARQRWFRRWRAHGLPERAPQAWLAVFWCVPLQAGRGEGVSTPDPLSQPAEMTSGHRSRPAAWGAVGLLATVGCGLLARRIRRSRSWPETVG